MPHPNDDLLHSPTTIPCPPWCGLDPFHGHKSEDAAGNSYRDHELDFPVPDEIGPPRSSAQLTQQEVAASGDGPVLSAGDLVLRIWVHGNTIDELGSPGTLTGPQARVMATALLAAADAWDAAAEDDA